MRGDITFGAFIRKKRVELEPYISLRKMAELLKLSPVHMSNIETGCDAAPKKEVLDNLARILKLDKQEREHMYDLAAESKNYTAVPSDLPEYITSHEYAKIALRVAKDVDATDKEWIEFIEKLKKRSRQEERSERVFINTVTKRWRLYQEELYPNMIPVCWTRSLLSLWKTSWKRHTG